MKRIFIIIAIAITCGLTAMAQDNPVSNHSCSGEDHEVIGIERGNVRVGITLTYNADIQCIFVNGLKDQLNYMVTIQSMTTLNEWNDNVTKFDNVINVSYLEAGKYRIILESSEGATYTYLLTIGDFWSTVFDGTRFPQLNSDLTGKITF